MNKDSVLKKEFKKEDVARVRNLVNKDYTSATKQQLGYSKTQKRYKEGDVWEENGKKWTIKNNLKQNITKLDAAKKALRLPLRCPNCGGPMKHHLAKKMYKIHGYCFDPCTVEMEAKLRRAGLYEQYEKRMMQGNMKVFIKDIEEWAEGLVAGKVESFVTEQGDVENWSTNTAKQKEIVKSVKEYTEQLKEHIT
jgi:ssDNA-binding Zn-finger/Zn-ribbon topoisomerase 1